MKTTKDHREYWKNRKIDWDQAYLSTWDHPHRQLIIWALKTFNWLSLWEIGCGPGANLMKIAKEIPNRQLGGSDINEDAIELARKTFVNGHFRVESVEDLLLSDRACDVILSDATLIYIGPDKIKSTINELKRITRERIVFCELHSNNWWKRWVYRYKTGYNVYNYKKLLENAGFYDVQIAKIPKEYWPGTPWETFGYIIMAKKA